MTFKQNSDENSKVCFNLEAFFLCIGRKLFLLTLYRIGTVSGTCHWGFKPGLSAQTHPYPRRPLTRGTVSKNVKV